MDDLVDALISHQPSWLLAETHHALLHAIFGTNMSANMKKVQAVKTEWRSALLEYLQKPKVLFCNRFPTLFCNIH